MVSPTCLSDFSFRFFVQGYHNSHSCSDHGSYGAISQCSTEYLPSAQDQPYEQTEKEVHRQNDATQNSRCFALATKHNNGQHRADSGRYGRKHHTGILSQNLTADKHCT